MKILVFVRLVADTSIPLRLDRRSGQIVTEDLVGIMNPPDAAAVEQAVSLAAQDDDEVIVASMGPSEAASILRQALASGADKAIFIEQDPLSATDGLATASRLAQLVRRLEPSLVLCGNESLDWGSGVVGPAIAEIVGIPHLAHVNEVRIQNRYHISVQRNLGGGILDEIYCALPVLLTFDASVGPDLYPSLPSLIDALVAKIEVDEVPPSQLSQHLPQRDRCPPRVVSMSLSRPRAKGMTPPSSSIDVKERLKAVLSGGVVSRRTTLLEGSPHDIAEQVVSFLDREGIMPSREIGE